MDSITKQQRSRNMAKIRGKDTKPELIVRRYLFKLGFRFRINQRIEKARPDIVLKKWKCCIFVHGCFWHRHAGCKLAYTPKSNTEFWEKKFTENQNRDLQNLSILQKEGWHTGVIWECSIRKGTFKEANISDMIKTGTCWEI